MARGRGRARRAARREERREAKAAKRQQRLDAKQMRIETRQGGKTDRSGLRAAARETAYENGIDPNAWVADSIGSVSSAASDIVQAKIGAGTAQAAIGANMNPFAGNSVPSAAGDDAGKKTQGDQDGQGGMGILMPVGLGLLALKMMKVI